MKIYNNYKGLVLAAGFGTRLKPLTDYIPKPALPLFGKPVLTHALSMLHNVGINSIAVNSHHLSEQIQKIVSGSPYNENITISYEKTILGTGGVHNPLKSWRENAYLIVYNSDIVSDIELDSMIASHENSKAISTMVLLPFAQKGKTIVYVKGAKVISIGAKPQDMNGVMECSFTAVSVVTEELLKLLPLHGFSSIIDAYNVAFELGLPINAYMHTGYWFDIGTPKDYFTVHVKLAHLHHEYIQSTLHKLQMMSDDVVIKDNVFFMGHNCVVHADCTFQNCIVLDGVTIQPNIVVKDCILYRDLCVPLD